MAEDDDWAKFPSEQKVAHKAWKARVAGYTELQKLFNGLDEKSPEFLKYGPLLKTFITDSNAAAQEKGVDAAVAFLNNAPQSVVSKCASEVISVAITKGLAAMKPKTKEQSQEIVMLMIEREKHEMVMEEFVTALDNKQPKFVATCALVLRDALRSFGPKVINVKTVLKTAPRLLEDRDPMVRDAGKQLVLEMVTWLGRAAIKPHLQALKPVQLQELDAEFDKIESQNIQVAPTRFNLTEQKKRAASGYVADVPTNGGPVAAVGAGPAAAVVETRAIDAWELADPEEIISKFPSDWHEKLESKKWQERKEALEPFEKLTSAIRLKPGEYGDLCHALLNVIKKDANVVVVQLAATILVGLAKGLRKSFSPYAHASLEAVLERSKEKKQTLIQTFREASDAIFVATNLEALAEHVLPYLSNKTPSVRIEAASFLDRCFTASRGPRLFGNKKLVKLYVAPLLILVSDPTVEVREAAFETLGCLHAFAGEKTVEPLLADVDPIRLTKIHEVSQKRVANAPATAAPAAVAAPPAAEPSKATAVKKPAGARATSAGASASSAPMSADSVDAAPVPAVKRAVKSAPAKKAGKADSKPKAFEESEISEDAAIAECSDIFGGEEIVKQLQSSNWKERQEATDKILTTLKSMSADSVPVQAVIRLLSAKAGLRDNNLPVMKLKLDIVAYLIVQCAHRFSKTAAFACLNDVIDKIGDAKNGPVVQKLLTDMADLADATPPEFLVPYVLSQAMSQKSPKTHQEALTWVSNVITDFGLRFNLKEVLPQIRQGLGSANGAVRTAAITAFGRLFLLTGATLRTLLEDEKPALLQLIDAEFERVKDQPVPKPTRGIRKLTALDEAVEEDAEDQGSNNAAAAAAAESALEALLPRVDISSKLTTELMEQLDDKASYKVRKEAIDKVLEIIKEAKLIHPHLGDLPSILVRRLKEANKVLVQSALTVCEALAQTMGRKIAEHIAVLGPSILVSFGDIKPMIRQQATTVMGVWVDQCNGNMAPFFENLLFSGALQAGNSILRAELLVWVAKRLPPTACRLPKDDLIASIPFLLAALEDRSGEVRKAGQDAALPFMIHTGYEPFGKALEALKPASRDQLAPIIDKVKEQLPPPPSRAPAAEINRSQTITKKPAGGKAVVVKPGSGPVAPVHSATEPVSSKASAPSPPPGKVSPGRASTAAAKSSAAGSPLRNRAMSALTLSNSPSTNVAASSAEQEAVAALFDERMSTPATKDARIREESKLKLLKWNFAQPSKEYLDQLRRQVTSANFSPILVESLFSTDVRQHIRAIDQMAAYAERKPVIVYSNIDLIFKWLTLRFFDNNTTLHIRCFKFLLGLLPIFGSNKLRLSDADVSCFMPYLLVKVGDSKDNIRRDVHCIVRAMCEVHPVHKLVPWIIDGLKSRNAKQRAECLDQLQTFFNDFDLASAGCDQAALISIMRSIAGQVADRDASVRNAALSCLVVAASRQGFGAEGILQHTASVMAPKERAMLEERLRRTCGGISFDSDQPAAVAPGTTVKPQTPNFSSSMALNGTATMTRPSRGSATPVASSLDPSMGRASAVVGTPGTNGTLHLAANAGNKTVTRRQSASARPAPRVMPPAEATSITPEMGVSENNVTPPSPSPVRLSPKVAAVPAPRLQRFEDPFGQNWAPPNLPPPLPPFTLAEEFLAEPPLIMPPRSVDPNTLPASNNMVPTILSRLNSAGLSVVSSEMMTPLLHLSLTAANRRINLEPHCDAVVSTLTSLLRRVCDALSPGSVPDLYRTEANYYNSLSSVCSNLDDLHSKLFQPKSPFAQKVSLRILRDHLSLLTNQIAAFSVFLTPIMEQRKNNSKDSTNMSPYESHLEAQTGLLHRLVAILKSVVRSANAGTLLVVLIELLQECVQRQSVAGESAINTGVKDLILKALWNITRHIDERHTEIANSSCNWEAIVGAAHRFFVAFPPSFWANQDSVPARTVRTIFNAAVVHLSLGKHILACYEKIFPDSYAQSQLYGWLLNCYQKHMATLNGNSSNGHNGTSSSQKENGISASVAVNGSSSYEAAVSAEMCQMKMT